MDICGQKDLIQRVAAVVLAGGQGTRLFPLTTHQCKPAVGFGGRYRLIDIPLSNSLNSHIPHLYVISQYFASHLNHHIHTTYHLDQRREGRIKVLCPEESGEGKVWFEGTADAVRQNLDHLLQAPVDYFLILSGDQLYNIDFRDMVLFAHQSQADLVVASLMVQEKEAQRMGVLKIDEKKQIVAFQEKPKEKAILDQFSHVKQGKTAYLASMGIYVFKRDALISLLKEPGHDFGHHLIPHQVSLGKAFAYEYKGYWVDIGTIASFYEANMALLKRKECLDMYDEAHPIYSCPQNLPSPFIREGKIEQSIISQGTVIEGAEISHSVIGLRSHIKKGSKIRQAVLMGNRSYSPLLHQSPPLPPAFSIGEECIIERAIIDEHCQLGRGVHLVNKKNVSTFDGDGVYIRDGIIIVTAGTFLPDGYSLDLFQN